MIDDESQEYDPNFVKRWIVWQFGCTVSLIQPGLVLKQGSNSDVAPHDLDDKMLRNRIYYARFVAANNGLSYNHGGSLPDSLPYSNISVFTHGDIGPRNFIVGENGRTTPLLDWESSGWFPDYWEFAQMMKFCDPLEHDWQRWMTRTRPEAWDITEYGDSKGETGIVLRQAAV